MDIINELENKKQEFEKVEDNIQQQQQVVNNLVDELKRLQGEYRLLVKMGQEQNLLDNEGNIIKGE